MAFLIARVKDSNRPVAVVRTYDLNDRFATIVAVLGRIATSWSLPKSYRLDANAQAGLTTGFSGTPDSE